MNSKRESVFIVHHEYERNEYDHVKFIGVFSSLGSAEKAVDKLKKEPGFSEWPDCFDITEYDLDQVHWLEGFGDRS